jgi:hypothetical protein
MTAVHALSGAEAAAITHRLDGQHIPVRIAVDEAETVHLYPQRQVTTREEVTALAAVLSWTDAPAAWRGPLRPIEPACLLCTATGVALEHDLCARCALVFTP